MSIRMKMMIGSLSLLALGLGCEKDTQSFVSWAIGLQIQGEGTFDEVTKSYKQILGDPNAAEQKGTINNGSFAGESSGTLEVHKTGKFTEQWTVVGKTYSNNPLLPGRDTFGEVPVYLVEQQKVEHDVSTYTKEVTNEESQPNVMHSYQTENTGFADKATSASTYGLAGDEYLVKMTDLGMLWDPNWELWEMFWKGDDINNNTALENGATWAGLKAGVEYLCQANPSVGDVWVNPDGTTIYRDIANESVPVGAGAHSAAKLELREVTNVNTMDIANRCLVIYDDADSAWTLAGNPVEGFDHADTFPTVHLDPGCEGSFEHSKIGHEWWYRNVLVKSETTRQFVTVTDYGWEWLEAEGANIVRKTSKVKTAAAANARAFVEFTYTTRTETYANTGWSEAPFDAL
ncbi:MAG: hypothetical protein GXP54_12820 [Deltaproteobacteria bacterium]|nr:hypothetical protein [Deltaproteobacteria bacterium]